MNTKVIKKMDVNPHNPTAQDTFEALKKTDYRSIYQRIDDISFCTDDWPDFYIEYCFLDNGTELTDEQCDELQQEYYDDLYQDALDYYMSNINWRKKF